MGGGEIIVLERSEDRECVRERDRDCVRERVCIEGSKRDTKREICQKIAASCSVLISLSMMCTCVVCTYLSSQGRTVIEFGSVRAFKTKLEAMAINLVGEREREKERECVCECVCV